MFGEWPGEEFFHHLVFVLSTIYGIKAEIG